MGHTVFFLVHAVDDQGENARVLLPRTVPQSPINLPVKVLMLQLNAPCVGQIELDLRHGMLGTQLTLKFEAGLIWHEVGGHLATLICPPESAPRVHHVMSSWVLHASESMLPVCSGTT